MATLVAREPEIARLSSLLDGSLRGQTRICFLQGAPGAGKTTLIQAFTTAAEARHPDLVGLLLPLLLGPTFAVPALLVDVGAARSVPTFLNPTASPPRGTDVTIVFWRQPV